MLIRWWDWSDDKIKEEIYETWQEEKKIRITSNGICEKIEKHKEESKNLRLFYLFPYDINRINLRKEETDIEKDIETIDQILHTAMIQDRNKAIDLVKYLSNIEIDMNTIKLGNLVKYLSKRKHYIIILYPHGSPSISLTKFTEDDIVKQIGKTREGFSIHTFFSKQKLQC